MLHARSLLDFYTTLLKEVIKMAILTMQNIMEAQDITETTVPVPEWDGEVVVRSVSYRKISSIKDAVSESQGGKKVSTNDVEVEKAILQSGMVNPEISMEQADALMDKSASAVMKVLTAIMGTSKTEGDDDVTKEEKSISPEQ